MVWLPDDEKKSEHISTRYDRMYERDGHTHTPHDGIGRACIASRDKNHTRSRPTRKPIRRFTRDDGNRALIGFQCRQLVYVCIQAGFIFYRATRICIVRTMLWQDVCPSVCPSVRSSHAVNDLEQPLTQFSRVTLYFDAKYVTNS